MLAAVGDVAHDAQTILIALADHGGGGTNMRDHESSHPLDRTIPLVIAGRSIVPTDLVAPTLLDVRERGVGAGPPSAGKLRGRGSGEAFATFDTPASAVA